MLNRLNGYRGDTIVEVIMVLAVLGLAISISYATANRSLLDARQAQEASQGARIVQSQLEALRGLSAPGNPQNVYQAGPYCISSSNTVVAWINPTTPDPSCITHDVNSDYTTNIKGPSGPPGGNFTIQVSWDDVEGQGTDTDTLAYNLYQIPLQ